MKKYFIMIVPLLFFLISCIGTADTKNNEANIIEKSLQKLDEKDVPETNEGVLIFERYRYYLSQLEKGNAYTDWKEYRNPPVYNPTAFLRMMDIDNIVKITKNAIDGKDAFDGITGLFERAYISDVDQTLDSYIIYVPHSFDPANKYPLLVLLHGYGDSALFNPYSPANMELLKSCEKKGVILVSPCGRQKLPIRRGLYIDDAEIDVLQVMKLVMKYYPVDDTRVYLTGDSMGGFGSYWIGGRHPDLFAAVAPVCGMWSGILGFPCADLDGLKDIPVYIFHNDLDKVVPVSESRTAYEYLKNIGANVKYKEIHVNEEDPWDYKLFDGHNAWDYVYTGTDLLDWFLQYKK